MQWSEDTKGVFRNVNQYRPDNAMATRYQRGIQKHQSLKIRQCNGHTIPKRYSETLITKGQTMQWPQDTKGVFRNVNH